LRANTVGKDIQIIEETVKVRSKKQSKRNARMQKNDVNNEKSTGKIGGVLRKLTSNGF